MDSVGLTNDFNDYCFFINKILKNRVSGFLSISDVSVINNFTLIISQPLENHTDINLIFQCLGDDLNGIQF